MSRSQTATICDSKTDNDCAIRRLTTMCYDAPLGNHTRQLNQTKPALSGHHVKDSLSRLRRTHRTQDSILRF